MSLFPSFPVFTRYRYQLLITARRILLCYGLYMTARLVFYSANRLSFQGPAERLLSDLFYGLWFDTFSIIATNCVFILLSIVPVKAFFRRSYQASLALLFLITNIGCLALNLVDAGYFPYIRKRSTSDLFQQLGGQSDVGRLIPAIISEYWWLLLVFGGIATVFVLVYRRIRTDEPPGTGKPRPIVTILCFFGACALAFTGLRGGFLPAPIDIVNAGAVTDPGRAALVLNTPFTVIKSLSKHPLEEQKFFSDAQLGAIIDPVHQFDGDGNGSQNVVVILLESFAKEYTKLGGKQSYTPFLDSLMDHSLVFTNAYANAVKSIEGIPAVLSSIPSMMDNPFINSVYANNRQTSFASLLGAEGYNTAFFHGGSNGTMNFTDWASAAGYQHYFGRDEYGNDSDYDGYWGIWDEPFLQYTAEKLNQTDQPFHAAVFTLSSHHPFRVPAEYTSRFSGNKHVFGAALRYADHSLGRFFETAQRMKWFKNSLFVLVADHAILADTLYGEDPLAIFRIPLLFYKPDNSIAGRRTDVTGQIDILPQALDLLGYRKPFFSLGKPPDRKTGHLTTYYADGYHYVFTDSLLFTYNGTQPHSAYNYFRDSALTRKLETEYTDLRETVDTRFRALLQLYSRCLTKDEMTSETFGKK